MREQARKIDGLWWPAEDKMCRPYVIGSEVDMNPALELTDGRTCAVQAGGNVGVWPIWLAARFDKVITFEPDPLNFWCLNNNVPLAVTRFNAGLGFREELVGMSVDKTNPGANFIEGEGDLPIIRLDALELNDCDFLCLDIEGYELLALMGARATLERFHPVIQIEDKGLSEKYGTMKGDAEKWLIKEFGYTVKARVRRDVILS